MNDDIADTGVWRGRAPTVGQRASVDDGVVAWRGDAVCFTSTPQAVVE